MNNIVLVFSTLAAVTSFGMEPLNDEQAQRVPTTQEDKRACEMIEQYELLIKYDTDIVSRLRYLHDLSNEDKAVLSTKINLGKEYKYQGFDAIVGTINVKIMELSACTRDKKYPRPIEDTITPSMKEKIAQEIIEKYRLLINTIQHLIIELNT